MKRLSVALCTVLFSLAVFAGPKAEQPKSLYQRLGGYDAIAAVTDDFLGRLATDKDLAQFFAGHSEDSLHRMTRPLCEAAPVASAGTHSGCTPVRAE